MHENESGTVDTFVNTQTDVTPTPKQEITHTTSKEDLQHVIARDWIYKSTFAIDANMKPGHIFGTIRIHPMDCNKYVAYIARMFRTWTGGMKIRTRFMANFANGGSFRIGFLPPNFTQADIHNVPLDTLTAYPNEDLDPKNTDWTEFKTSDQRNVMYHYMADPSTADTAEIGGWIVFYVVGSLVQTLQTSGTVQMVVETAGDFVFRQVAPLTDGPAPSTLGPLPTSVLTNLLLHAGCDTQQTTGDAALQIIKSEFQSMPAGFMLATAVDGTKPETKAPNSKISPYCTYWRSRIQSGAIPSSLMSITVSDFDSGRWLADIVDSGSIPIYNCDGDLHHGFGPISTTGERWRFGTLNSITDTFTKYRFHTEGQNFTEVNTQGSYYTIGSGREKHNPLDVSKIPHSAFGTSSLINQRAGESILAFADLSLGSIDMQTRAIAEWLKAHPASIATDYLYSLRSDEDIGILLYVRLQPSGMFTTTATTQDIVMAGKKFYLQYEGEISPSAPLPSSSSTQSFIRMWHKIGKKAAKHGLTIATAYRMADPLSRS